LLFTITGKHVEVTDSIKRHAEEKTAKLPKYYDSINRVEVIVDRGPNGSVSVEIIARAERNNTFVVSETAGDAYRCIDLAVHKLESQLRKKKGRERDNKHVDNSE